MWNVVILRGGGRRKQHLEAQVCGGVGQHPASMLLTASLRLQASFSPPSPHRFSSQGRSS